MNGDSIEISLACKQVELGDLVMDFEGVHCGIGVGVAKESRVSDRVEDQVIGCDINVRG